ncbi:hypothetical protein [Hoeflea sp.]|uniref:hypothetical protein n=1 Tax=Hoeflea sp. TaxID=1940281 RepID=UPI003748CF3C
MILGQSLFDSVLEKVGRENSGTAQSGYSGRVGIRGLSGIFMGSGSASAVPQPDNQPIEAYLALNADGFEPVPEPVVDYSRFERISLREIEADLNIAASDSLAALQVKRRDFARHNHPDRVPEEWREAATMRMKTANLLIDQALRNSTRKSR